MKKTGRTMLTMFGDVLVLVYSSIGPEDTGPDEEDMQGTFTPG